MAEAGAGPRPVVLRGGTVGGADGVLGSAVAVVDGRVAAVGTDDDADGWVGTGPDAPQVVDLAAGLVLPAFVDSHVHTVRTGVALTGLDLTGAPTLTDALDRLAAHAAAEPDRGVLLGQGWDETGWREQRPPTGAELERAAPGRRVCLTRVDAHSSVVSPALASLVPGLDGLDGATPDGRVERDAHHAVRHALEALVGDGDRLRAARAAVAAMAAQGIACFHENAAPHIGPETEIELVRRAAEEVGLHPVVYWGELMAVDTARRLGAVGLAGDLVADGAFGSRTAALAAPYADAPGTCGHGYVTAEQVRDHVVLCTEVGLQAGFHVIGDAALEEVVTGLEAAAALLGDRWVPRHRLEHVEMPSARVCEALGRLGVVSSVQPVFDALWGGPDGMYAARLGKRWRVTNPFASLADAGSTLALGSDSPVTALGGWAAVRAAAHHHAPEHAVPVADAFRAHTLGGWRAARVTDRGEVALGQPADLAVWSAPEGASTTWAATGLPDLTPGQPLPRLERLLVAGRTAHDAETR